MNAPEVHVGPWEPADGDDPPRRLFATMHIDGVPHHLEAIPVRVKELDGGGSVQEATTDEMEGAFDHWYLAAGGDGAFMTVTIEGADYAVFLSPFCE